MNTRKQQSTFTPYLRAKLSFDEGFAERPLYVLKAKTNEKEKGIDMVELIAWNFNISEEDMRKAFKKKMREFNEDSFRPTKVPKTMESKQKKIQWKKDDEGKIVSPFPIKKWKD